MSSNQSPRRARRSWMPRRSFLGVLLIFLVPLGMMAIGWGMRGWSDLPVPQLRPGKLPDAYWASKGKLETPRDDFGTAVVDGKIWVLGGMTGDRGNRLDTTEVYDPATDRWTPGPNLTSGRSSFRAVAIDRTIYLFGGASREKFGIDTAEALDTTTGQWQTLPPLPTGRFGHAVVELGGKIYVIGGYSAGRAIGSVQVYEPDTRAWRQVASLPTPRYNLAAAVLGGKIYAIGGWVNDEASVTVEIFDPASGAWSGGPALPAPLSNFGAAVLDERIHVALHQIHQVYDPRAKRWIAADAMPTTRHGEGLAVVGDTLYAIGGCYEDPQYDLDTVEAYLPGEAPEPEPNTTGIHPAGAVAVTAGVLMSALLVALVWRVNRRSARRDLEEPAPGEQAAAAPPRAADE